MTQDMSVLYTYVTATIWESEYAGHTQLPVK
ncbi:hypothetical protein HASA104033_03530 [Halobacterium salinarum]